MQHKFTQLRDAHATVGLLPCSNTYIAGLDVYFGSKDKPQLQPGWELITSSVGGNGGNLNKGGDECYLAIKRAPVDILDGEL